MYFTIAYNAAGALASTPGRRRVKSRVRRVALNIFMSMRHIKQGGRQWVGGRKNQRSETHILISTTTVKERERIGIVIHSS